MLDAVGMRSICHPQVTEVSRKKRRTANKGLNRSIVGASMELIQKKRAEKPEVGRVELSAPFVLCWRGLIGSVSNKRLARVDEPNSGQHCLQTHPDTPNSQKGALV